MMQAQLGKSGNLNSADLEMISKGILDPFKTSTGGANPMGGKKPDGGFDEQLLMG
eukprot:CAMPEP_0114582540 /NCGR_PEP_ID=MMETSP0125-20121206/6497_1 /TAXON_ID=485358 ORGANISM="Aristerostoma sp., Strain ATCC 50986" /NCGR_SAMPLE_ID=MMETSP0125 /ASSEMBLY_ACC=CAM_ASM_000245 /LENGTH=54 /DNA_ID=CAMNT_0001775547 /DNA_START=822 /DNA_END=986 /DNA_ORIENTATION=+